MSKSKRKRTPEDLREQRRGSIKYKLLTILNENPGITSQQLATANASAIETVLTHLWDMVQLGLVESSDETPVTWTACATAEQMLDLPDSKLKHGRRADQLKSTPLAMRNHFGTAPVVKRKKRDWQRNNLEAMVQQYLDNGGTIEKLPHVERAPGRYPAGASHDRGMRT